MSDFAQLEETITHIAHKHKGILAADESHPTMAKRFKAIDVDSTEESRRNYRSLILATPGLGKFISGVILFEETFSQSTDDGIALPELALRENILPGIKLDKGKIPMANCPGDEITQGLDGLAERVKTYKKKGARFAKWRDVYHIGDALPSHAAISANAEVLARYAAICQSEGVVPIVEPEVLIDGDHHIEVCAEVTEAVLREVFASLYQHRVALELSLLKPSMVIPGKACADQCGPSEIAEQTIKVFRRAVPAAVPSIHFLSGGQTPEQATENLNAMNQMTTQPWELSFSYGRALQQPALQAWRGDSHNAEQAQAALLHRARLNSDARRGAYRE